jgi:hypothetical protein
METTAVRFATVELAHGHVAEVKAKRLPEIDKVEQEVRARLKKEVNYWDARAFEKSGPARRPGLTGRTPYGRLST